MEPSLISSMTRIGYRLYQKTRGASQEYKLAGRVEGTYGRAWNSLR
jgi:hypothetical protein